MSVASERRYYDDAYTTAFPGRVAAVGEHAGRPAIELAETWFYPESGGQLADRGTIGAAGVTDVQSDDDGRVWHLIEGDAPGAGSEPACAIDWARRFDHMQQHTGQHVLSAAFERVREIATLSSTLGAERNVIELAMDAIDWHTAGEVETAANRVLWEDREIRLHWTDDQGVKRFALRKPPAVSGRIRIVEIPEWDVSACGGTHARRTGEVGAIKIVGWEKVRGNVRVAFVCGERALRDHAWRAEALLESARRRTLKDRDLLAHLERAADERDALAKQLRGLTARLLADEAAQRVGRPPSGVAECAQERPREDVRAFALACLTAGAPWVVSAARSPEPALVLGRAKGGAGDLRTLVPALLEASGGRGGGSPDQVQISAPDAAGLDRAFALAAERLPALVAGA
ncbi:MAG TPA: alanyl-tRNA editing protein [Candidatus Acidoferrales bacterium]|nr:alanyl-tRNA editing protein [Candidatus Acidoferrales bacterium]